MKVVVKKTLTYRGHRYDPGAEFDTKTDTHAKILVAARKVEYAPKAQAYKTRQLKAEDAQATPRRRPANQPPAKADQKEELSKLLKPQLVEMAEAQGVEVKSTDTKAEIIEKLSE